MRKAISWASGLIFMAAWAFITGKFLLMIIYWTEPKPQVIYRPTEITGVLKQCLIERETLQRQIVVLKHIYKDK